MNARLTILPTLCLGVAALLVVPVRGLRGFSTLGGSLDETQRDVRVFDNFADATANNNAAPSSQFPGWLGLELAIWKSIVEWGSRLHGDGSGDPLAGNLLGSGGANFDALFAGNAVGAGGTNRNIVSAQASCGGAGTLAFTETPISDGWRILFCDNWNWDDGPAGIGSRWDIQGVMAHEYGHALGLGHSTVTNATMFASGSPGQTSTRSIAPDDIDGVRFLYGLAATTKPTIVATAADPASGMITIHGSNFDPTDNEVWFTNANATGTVVDPIVRVTGAASSNGNKVITVSIPPNAGPGDVMIDTPGSGGATLSNAFPTDLVGTLGVPPGPHPHIALIAPATIDALIPGPAQTITITGTDLDLASQVLLDGAAIPPLRYTLVDATTITLDMPQAATLGAHELGVSDGVVANNFQVMIVAPATPRYECGNGDPLNVIDRDTGLSFRMSGTVGASYRVVASTLPGPSVIAGVIRLDLGNGFTEVCPGKTFTIPAAGWMEVSLPPAALLDPGLTGLAVYSQFFALAPPFPLAVSNLQSNFIVQ